jgi:O-antigen/teichoic acid export membrane protein
MTGTSTAPTAEAAGAAGRGARTVVVLAVAEVLGKVCTLALLLYAVRELTPEEFGSFSYALAFGLLLAALPTWGLDALMVQQTGADRRRLPGQYAQLLVLRTALAVPVIVVGTVFGMATRSEPGDRVALVALLVSAVLESYAHAPRAVGGVLRRQSVMAAVLVAQRVLTVAAGVVALATGLGLAGLAVAYLLTTLAGTAALFATADRMGIRPSWTGIRGDLGLTARRSLPLGIDALVAMLVFRADTILLGWFHGDEAVAQYTAPYRIVETVLFLTWAVSRVIYPVMAAAPDLPALRGALTRGLAVAAFLFAPFTALSLVRGGDVITLLFGEYYADTGTTTLRILAATPLLFAFAYILGQAFVAAGRSSVIMTTGLISATINVVANLLLLPVLSTTGAALTTTGAYLLETGMLLVLARRHLGGIGPVAVLALPLAAALPAAGVAALPLPVVPALALAGTVYLAVWLAGARRWQPEQAATLLAVLPNRRGAAR